MLAKHRSARVTLCWRSLLAVYAEMTGVIENGYEMAGRQD
jgi:hypothetical protein